MTHNGVQGARSHHDVHQHSWIILSRSQEGGGAACWWPRASVSWGRPLSQALEPHSIGGISTISELSIALAPCVVRVSGFYIYTHIGIRCARESWQAVGRPHGFYVTSGNPARESEPRSRHVRLLIYAASTKAVHQESRTLPRSSVLGRASTGDPEYRGIFDSDVDGFRSRRLRGENVSATAPRLEGLRPLQRWRITLRKDSRGGPRRRKKRL